MSWKKEMDLLEPIKNVEVANYLKEMGFEVGTMTAFSEEINAEKSLKTKGEPCLIKEKYISDEGNLLIIRINDTEAVMERIYDGSSYGVYVGIDEELTVDNVDGFLDKLF